MAKDQLPLHTYTHMLVGLARFDTSKITPIATLYIYFFYLFISSKLFVKQLDEVLFNLHVIPKKLIEVLLNIL